MERLTSRELRALQPRAQRALARRLLERRIALDGGARTEHLDDNLAAPLTVGQAARVRRDFGARARAARERAQAAEAALDTFVRGAGRERFAAFLDRAAELVLGGRSGFTRADSSFGRGCEG